MLILGIETSCDETAAALLQITHRKSRILNQVVSSQVKIHQKYGGIVPEVAARRHVELIIPIIEKVTGNYRKKINLIAVTAGPGLITSLMVGTETAKVLSYLWQKPIIGVNHLEGHIYSNWLPYPRFLKSDKIFPAICLVVSGGHTELILMKGHGKYQLLGRTRDDAAGEAFDKVAKILEIGYPGGPVISQSARNGNPNFVEFSRPMINDDSFDFSFSGLKTAVLYEVRNNAKLKTQNSKFVSNICASFQQAVVDVLIAKTIRAAREYKVKNIMLSGGVSANKHLRNEFRQQCKKEKIKFYCPALKYTGDNAVMIALAGYFKNSKLRAQDSKNWQKIKPQANWEII